MLLYSHGFSPVGAPNPAQNSPRSATRNNLLDEGYALIGSSYATSGWAVTEAEARYVTHRPAAYPRPHDLAHPADAPVPPGGPRP